MTYPRILTAINIAPYTSIGAPTIPSLVIIWRNPQTPLLITLFELLIVSLALSVAQNPRTWRDGWYGIVALRWTNATHVITTLFNLDHFLG